MRSKLNNIIASTCIFSMLVCPFQIFANDVINTDLKEVQSYEVNTRGLQPDIYIPTEDGNLVKLTDKKQIEEYMINSGKVAGSTFNIGSKEYLVLDNYNIELIKENNITDNILSDKARGTSVPTYLGSLPTYGYYNMSNYVYSNYYFHAGYGNPYWTQVLITPDSSQTITVQIIDASMGTSMQTNTLNISQPTLIFMAAKSDNNFYYKFINSGSGYISGDYTLDIER